MTTESLSVLVASFLVVGALGSALSSSDPQWWLQHFSALGASADRTVTAAALAPTGGLQMRLGIALTRAIRVKM